MAPLRPLVSNNASPDAPVLGMRATDRQTIVITLKEPVAYMVNWFACFGSPTGQILMYPKETGSSFDIRQDMIGTGPFQLKQHTNSVSFVLERNPDYWDKDFALVQTIEQPVLGEYAARLSQLRAGNLHFWPDIRAEDVVPLKRDEPGINLYETSFLPTTTVWTFGHLPVGSNKFQDERVRQAVSMSWDRDLFNLAKYDIDTFESQGVPIRTGWNSHLANRDPFVNGGWFLDPQGKDFGDNAKYFQYDLTEAKKLLSAAGFPNGFDVTFHYPASPQYNLSDDSVPMIGFLQALGLNVKQRAITDYTNDYIPNDRDASGAYEGIGIHSVTGGIPSVVSPTSALVAEHWPPSGVTFHGYDVNGRGDKSGDPVVNEMLAKARLERDLNAQKKLVIDVQRYLGKAMHSLVFPGGATTLYPAWAAVQNYRVWSGEQPFEKYQLWVDQTKPPFAT
jgi:ABC-type transport system substrate-binding protein